MAVNQNPDIRALLGGGSDEDRLAATHFMVGAAFLALGGALQLVGLLALRFAGLFPITFGRLEPMANLTLMIGFGAISLIGGVYYVLPRLTGSRLWNPQLALYALLGTAGLVVAGLISLALGLGDGTQPFGLGWFIDVPLASMLSVPMVVTLRTIGRREEKHSFVTLWFVIGGVLWLPLLYIAHLVTELPSVSAVTMAYGEAFLSAGFVTMFLITVGTGLVYYTVVKELDVALASRQLAAVGFWSLGFAGVWWGTAQLMFGPTAGWVAGVSAALGLAFPLGALANAANVSLTLEGSWSELSRRQGVLSGVYGLYLVVGLAVVAAMAGFRSVGSIAANTALWEAIEHVAIGGVSVLLVAGISLAALPRLVGRDLDSVDKARRFNQMTVTGAVGLVITMGAAGLISGYSWTGGSNSGSYVDAGEGWGAGAGGSVDALMLIAVFFGVILFLGQLGYVGRVFGTVARGHAVPQEVMVTKEPADG